jgi:hypothetical protein
VQRTQNYPRHAEERGTRVSKHDGHWRAVHPSRLAPLAPQDDGFYGGAKLVIARSPCDEAIHASFMRLDELPREFCHQARIRATPKGYLAQLKAEA